MRVEIELIEAGAVTPRRDPTVGAAPRHRPRIDGFDLGVLAAFAAMSVWVLGLDLWQVVAHGRVWTGTDGFYLVDQMQYLAWIRDASQHVLASNLFVLRSTPNDYFQPAVVISGGLTAIGVAPWLSLLLWKPVAVGAAFYAVRKYVRRSLTGTWPRRAALVLGLFFGSFGIVYGAFGVVGDLFLGFESWGYTFGLIAVAAMVVALLAYDRGVSSGRMVWAPALLGALASLLHPWQGELLIVILVATELAMLRGWRQGHRRLTVPAVTVAMTALPLAYYAILGRTDLSWQLARDASKHSFPLWAILLAVGPLLLPAALAYRRRTRGFLDVATRVWPLATVAVYLLSGSALSATPLHAFEGITIPLAVLAVEGVRRFRFHRLERRRLVAPLAVALATIPATVYLLASATSLVAPAAGNPNFITEDEQRALEYLETNRQPGGVITRFYLGSVVPAETGRRTLVGDCLWSEPDCTGRAQTAEALIDGTLQPQVARQYVLQSRARFLLSDCQSHADLRHLLGPVVLSVREFGCAAVYEVS